MRIFSAQWRLPTPFAIVMWVVLLTIAANPLSQVTVMAQPSSCLGAPPLRLTAGSRGHLAPPPPGQAQVSARIHDTPGTTSAVVGLLNDGDPFTVTAGPQCAASFAWWKIKTDSGISGWVAEGNPAQYFVEPLPANPTPTAAGITGTAGPTLTMTARPTATARPTDSLPPVLTILDSHNPYVFGVAWSPDGKTLVSSSDGKLTFWSASGQFINEIATHGYGGYRHLQWSPDGSMVAGLDRGTRQDIIVTTPDGHDQYSWHSDHGDIADLAWSPDSKGIAFGGADKTVTIWTLNHGADLTTALTNIHAAVTSLAWSDTRLAAGLVDSSIHIWVADRQNQTVQNTLLSSDYNQPGTMSTPDYAVSALAWSHNGRELAAAYESDRILLWNGDTRGGMFTPGGLRGHTAEITSVDWSPDDQMLASAANDNTVRLWSYRGSLGVLTGFPQGVGQVSWSVDGHTLAAAGIDGKIRLWQSPVAYAARSEAEGTATGAALEAVNAPVKIQTTGYQLPSQPLVWSPDGSRFAANASLDRVGIWDKNGHPVATLNDSDRQFGANVIAWSPDGQTIVTAGLDKQIRFWSPDGTLIRTLAALKTPLTGLAWSPDGKTLASCDSTSLQLRGPDGTVISTVLSNQFGLLGVHWSPDGQLISVGAQVTNQAELIMLHSDGSPWRTLHLGFGASPQDSGWSPNSQLLAIAVGQNLTIWQRDSFVEKMIPISRDQVHQLAWAPDGKTLVVTAGADLQVFSPDGSRIGQQKGFGSAISGLNWSPDGSLLASIDQNGTILLWTASALSAEGLPTPSPIPFTATPTPVSIPIPSSLTPYHSIELRGHKSGIRALAWSPDGKTLASGSNDFGVNLWQNGALLTTLTGHTREITALAWSPNESTLASSALDGTIRLWDAQGKPLTTIQNPNESTIQLSWSPDGNTLASRDAKSVWLWSTTGHKLAQIAIPDTVHGMAWSPDSKILATGDQQQHIILYNASGYHLGVTTMQFGSVDFLSWSADGTTLIMVSLTQGIVMLNAKSPSLSATTSAIHYPTNLGPLQGIGGAVWSPNSKLLALYYKNAANPLQIFDTKGQQIGLLLGHQEPITSLAWSPDGSLLASGSMDNTVRLWHPDGTLAALLDGHSDSVTVLAWSPDGKTLATGSDDSTIRLWTPS